MVISGVTEVRKVSEEKGSRPFLQHKRALSVPQFVFCLFHKGLGTQLQASRCSGALLQL